MVFNQKNLLCFQEMSIDVKLNRWEFDKRSTYWDLFWQSINKEMFMIFYLFFYWVNIRTWAEMNKMNKMRFPSSHWQFLLNKKKKQFSCEKKTSLQVINKLNTQNKREKFLRFTFKCILQAGNLEEFRVSYSISSGMRKQHTGEREREMSLLVF